MIKKIVGWTLLGALVIILAAGAVNRTLAKSGDSTGINAQWKGRTQENGQSIQGNDQVYRQSNQDQMELENREGSSGYGRRNIGYSQVDNESTNFAKNGDIEWYTFEGTVVSVETEAMKVTIAEDTTVEVANRAWRVVQKQGFNLQPGDSILLTGFYENDDHFEASYIEKLDGGGSIQIRDENGRPVWAGNRRGG